jgi:hypothetical protein
MTAASERRIIAYQALYAFGALLSVFSPHLSIGFIVENPERGSRER